MKNLLKIIFGKYLTDRRGKPEISKTREILTQPIRETKLTVDSLTCPYCASKNFVKRGWRAKKLEKVQLLLCHDCGKTFTPQITKGKHYPLATIFDAVSLYNLGYSLEESCRAVNERQQKTTLASGSLTSNTSDEAAPDLSSKNLSQKSSFVKRYFKKGVDLGGIEPPQPDLTDQVPHRSRPTPNPLYTFMIQPSTLSNWLTEFKEMTPFNRMRDFMMRKYTPKNAVETCTLAHRQLYRYRLHRAKCTLIMQEHFHHSYFKPLKEFLELVSGECPHQYFQTGLRASEAPLTFNKTAMIVRGKTNFATKTAAFVLQSVKERKNRHDALQKFMFYNDSVTVATEVPVYLTRDDIEHMKTQLGFEIYTKKIDLINLISNSPNQNPNPNNPMTKNLDIGHSKIGNSLGQLEQLEIRNSNDLPKLITGHIDILQIRNGQIHILDYKPNAEKERPIEQLTLYAMALSRLTGLRLFEFKCAWFDEKDYFEFYPLHVLHKPKKARRRRKVETKEGTYKVNKDENKIKEIKPYVHT